MICGQHSEISYFVPQHNSSARYFMDITETLVSKCTSSLKFSSLWIFQVSGLTLFFHIFLRWSNNQFGLDWIFFKVFFSVHTSYIMLCLVLSHRACSGGTGVQAYFSVSKLRKVSFSLVCPSLCISQGLTMVPKHSTKIFSGSCQEQRVELVLVP